MSDQTQRIICNIHLCGRGIWSKTCAACTHVKCSGLNRGSDHGEVFGYIRCTSLTTDNTTTDIQEELPTQPQRALSTNDQNLAIKNSNEIVTATPVHCSFPTPELKGKIRTNYNQVVHWKPVFMILGKNTVVFNFIETLNRALNSLNETQENTYAFHATMIFPHLVLCKPKSESDDSNFKIIAKTLKQWHRAEWTNFLSREKHCECAWQKVRKRK